MPLGVWVPVSVHDAVTVPVRVRVGVPVIEGDGEIQPDVVMVTVALAVCDVVGV